MAEQLDSLTKILLTREGNSIIRNHTQMCATSAYNVGNHSAAMAQLLFILFPGVVSTNLVQAILFHDAGSEFATGDIIGDSKHRWPSLGLALKDIENEIDDLLSLMPVLTVYEAKILLILDYMELCFHAKEQMAMGVKLGRWVRMLRRVEKRIHQYLIDINREDIWFGIYEKYDEKLASTEDHY